MRSIDAEIGTQAAQPESGLICIKEMLRRRMLTVLPGDGNLDRVLIVVDLHVPRRGREHGH
jgi:hypothetical protein